jgi:hypothetical protein
MGAEVGECMEQILVIAERIVIYTVLISALYALVRPRLHDDLRRGKGLKFSPRGRF